MLPQAEKAVHTALELDPRRGDAHIANACLLYQFGYDWVGADREFPVGLRLNPGWATGHQWYSRLLAHSGRFLEALREIQIAEGLSPVDTRVQTEYGQFLRESGRKQEALQRLEGLS